jgi:TRAP-type C4-dicarboxylate transport system substrate-binding protein
VQRAALDKATAAALKFQRDKSQELEGVTLTKFAGVGVNVINLTSDEKAAWQKIITDNKIFDMVRQKMDHPELVDEMLK